jgi:hypothetical protein
VGRSLSRREQEVQRPRGTNVQGRAEQSTWQKLEGLRTVGLEGSRSCQTSGCAVKNVEEFWNDGEPLKLVGRRAAS